jgi:predicted esterase YcpF (UPF0227 family)
MKKSKVLLIGIILAEILITAPIIIAASNTIQAYLINHRIVYHRTLNDSLQYPLISYNDNTYMAIRDVAELWNKNISWDEENQSINLSSRRDEYNIIKQKETALAIGKAILEEYYGEKITEKAMYDVTYAMADRNFWYISIVFSPSEEANEDQYVLLNPDVRVEIDPVTCNFRLLEMQPDGGSKEIVPFKTW